MFEFGDWILNCHCKGISSFKFGGSAQDYDNIIYKYSYVIKKFSTFNLVVAQAVFKYGISH